MITGTIANTRQAVIGTLLLMGSRILEVAADGTIINTWEDDSITHNQFTAINNQVFIARHAHNIKQCAASSIPENIEYKVISGDTIFRYKVRFLHIPAIAIQSVFVAIDFLSAKRVGKVSEDYWKLALDASGDGTWDVHVPSNTIALSDRWYTTFGYPHGHITTIAQWLQLIHPEDVEKITRKKVDYFEGRTPFYTGQFRIKCADNTYKWVLSRGMIVACTPDGAPLRFLGTHTDISAHKNAEEKYFSLAQMLTKLINNLRDGILVADENKKIIYANQMFCDLYNLPDPPATLLGMDMYESIALRKPAYKDPEKFCQRTIEVLENMEMVLGEEWEMINGKIVGRDHIPLALGAGNKGSIWKFRDITIQKNNEKQLADLRHFYEQILNHIDADIVVFDPEQRYIFINPSAVKNSELRGWMIGKTDEDYRLLRNKPLEFSRRRTQIFEEARATRKNIEWEEMLINRNGEPEFHLRNHYPVFDAQGNHLMSIGYGLNITDRVLAQQELKTSRDTFASAFRDSGIGMALLSHEGMYIDANNALCDILEYSKYDLQQRSLQDVTHPDDVYADAAYMSSMLHREISTYNTEKRFISNSGKTVLVSLTMSLVWSNEGLPKFFILQAVDITRRKEMELELIQKNTELEETRQSLINKVNQLEDLSHIIAHNLRGPAGNIKMLSEALLDLQEKKQKGDTNQDGAFTEEEATLLIHDSSMSLMESLSTLMQITEIKLNKEIHRNNCDIPVIVNDFCNQLQGVILEKNATIRRRFDVKTVDYPRMYLESILYNLISNALKYARPDTIPEIDISTAIVNNRVILTVKDNGLGIDMVKYGARVFKLNQVFHKGFDSKGVGLYITKTMVETMGGHIELHSAPNEGSEFIVTL